MGVSTESPHDVTQVVGEELPVVNPSGTRRSSPGIGCESLSDAVDECGDEIVAGREVVRGSAAWRAGRGVDSAVRETACSFLRQHADPGVGESRAFTAWEQIGEVSGPFPSWDALGLDWPRCSHRSSSFLKVLVISGQVEPSKVKEAVNRTGGVCVIEL